MLGCDYKVFWAGWVLISNLFKPFRIDVVGNNSMHLPWYFYHGETQAMNYIHKVIAILGITSVVSGLPAAISAQVPQSRIQQTNFQGYYSQGVQKLNQGNFNGAIEDFNSVVQLNPRYYEGYCLRGLAEFHLGNLKAALSDFNSTLQLNPNHADAYRGRGTAYAQLGDFQKAIADFNQTIKIEPTSPDGYYNLGLANYKQGNHKQAVVNFNSALNRNPNLADAYGNRGLAQYALGDNKSAVADLNQAASLFQQQGNTQGYQQTQALIQQIQQ